MAEPQNTSQFGAVMPWQPGMAILKFVQGMVEMVVRVAIAAVVLYALLSAAGAISRVNKDDSDIFEVARDCDSSFCQEIDDLRKNTLASAGYVVAMTALALLTQFVMIVIRFLNITVINTDTIKSALFLIINAALSFFFGVGLFAGAIAMAVFAADYQDLIDMLEESFFFDDAADEFEQIRSSLISSTVFCFLSVMAFGFLGVWMVLFIVLKWNDKLKKDHGQNYQ